MAKYGKKYESWGGRDLIAVINGKVTGVKCDKANKTYFYRHPQPSGTAKKVNLGRNKGKAANKWWAIVEKHQKEQLQNLPTDQLKTRKAFKVSQQPHQTEEEFDAMVHLFVKKASKQKGETLEEWKGRVYNNPKLTPFVDKIETLIPEKILAIIFNKWLEDPYDCSKKLGDERIANLDKLSTRDAINLKEMGDYYYNWIPTDREQASETERKKIVKWWEQFSRIVSKTYLDELSKSDIQHYTSTVITTANKDNRSKTWIAHRFGACRTVINTYARSLEDKVLCRKVVEWLKDFPAPKSINGKTDDFNPNRLTKKQWHKLLALVSSNCKTTTQKEWRAIVLFALNTCSYGITCRNVLMSNIDGNELRIKRGKRGKTPKIGILWDDTVEAIAEFRQGKIGNSKYVFPSRTGTQYTEGGFYDYWVKYIRAKLSWDFDFRQLRDSGRYGAETGKASPNKIEMAMGHRLKGVDDAYLFRHPELTQEVADAIYSYYML